MNDIVTALLTMIDPTRLPDLLRDIAVVGLAIAGILHVLDHKAHRA